MSAASGPFRWVLVCLRPYWRPLGLLGCLSLAEVTLRVLAPWPLKAIVDRLVSAGDRAPSSRAILTIAGAGLLIQALHQLVLLFHTRVQTRLGQRLVFDTQSRLFSQLQYLSLGQHEHVGTSDAVYRVNNDAASLEQLVLRGFFPMIFSALTLLSMFVVLSRIQPTLAILSMVVVPLLYLGLRLHMRHVHDRAEHARQCESALMGRTLESLSAIRVVKAFAREEYELARFTGAAQKAMCERFSVTRLDSLFSFLVGTLTVGGTSLVLAVGALYVAQNRISVGTLLVIMAYLGFVYGPMSAIATTTGSLQHAMAGVRRVREILDLPQETDLGTDRIEPGRFSGAVIFDRVSFGYANGTEVLHDISFSVEPGETVALVGPSGAGKSTLVSLLGRLHHPTRGCVLVDGIDVQQIVLKSLREQIAIVPQEPVMFSGSIADNIRYGQLNAGNDAVVRAARAANAEEFILETRDGYDTVLKESGQGLSVGQRQRLSMARAFLKNAPLLILDEPTASLDTISEQRVLAAMRELRTRRTTFVIAHRMSSVRDADRILVLDAGRLVAEGRHDDLLRSCPLYARLCFKLVDDRPVVASMSA